MNTAIQFFFWLPLALGVYAYLGYPFLLAVVARLRPARVLPPEPVSWPLLTLTVPCYNEAASLRQTLEYLLTLDYPADRRQILVISDASTDGTDDIVREFAARGVELVRLETRRGKSAAENAAGPVARGDIIVNTDATIRILPHALKALVRAFGDPTVGVASGRDVSVANTAEGQVASGESGYVGYEMSIRALETRVHSIVGASGCFYGIRRSLYDSRFPESLSRDFASALMAREHGYRAVSVDDAVCLVPRTKSLQSEFRRKIRTMARGLQTLWYKRHLLNPLRYGSFGWMLFSHKLCRWLVYPALPLSAIALVLASIHSMVWTGILALAIVGTALGVIGMRWSATRQAPALLSLAGFALASNVAGLLAWMQVLRNQRAAVWEPTRR
ncbi:MAG TPA: glycosyltransferase family 2 protein [Gemmatimonadaceae bacterium]|nr:glycosyltransferase family 2 protein [Gemmatimonadaceae bacterium]